MLGMRVISVSSVEVSGPPFLLAPFFPSPPYPQFRSGDLTKLQKWRNIHISTGVKRHFPT